MVKSNQCQRCLRLVDCRDLDRYNVCRPGTLAALKCTQADRRIVAPEVVDWQDRSNEETIAGGRA